MNKARPRRHTGFEVRHMSRKKKKQADDLRLDPEARLCPKFDSQSMAMFPVAKPEEMGFRVLDNCAEEHTM